MGVDEHTITVKGSEDGEISDEETGMIHEINEVEFKVSPDLSMKSSTPEVTTNTTITMTAAAAAATTTDSPSSYWEDVYKYSYPRGYPTSGLYHLAWARAVQNKPLNELLVEFKAEEKSAGSQAVDEKNNGVNNHSVVMKEENDDDTQNDAPRSEDGVAATCFAVVDDEKEEGELEEGEIDMDFEPIKVEEKNCMGGRLGEMELEDEELERRVESIREVLENVSGTEAEKSFDFVCARLKISLESLKQLVLHCWFPSKDELIQLSFAAVQCVNSVFNSMSHARKDQTKNAISRLLTYVMDLKPPLFSPEHMKEVKDMLSTVSSFTVPLRTKTGEKQEELPVARKAVLTDSNSLAVNVNENINSSDGAFNNEAINLFDVSRPLQASNSMSKLGYGPLLDLHKVHDEDSLPSPTSSPTVSPFTQMMPLNVVGRPGSTLSTAEHEVSKSPMHPYETDAVKAVSSYQQKFGQASFLSFDRLPSPTPSEESNGGPADDAGEEATSSSAFSTETAGLPDFPQRLVSSASNTSSSSLQGLVHSNSRLPDPDSTPVVRLSAKNRDPRLRYMNPNSSTLGLNSCPLPAVASSVSKLEPLEELINSKKHKATNSPETAGVSMKKLRNGLEMLADGDTIGPQNVGRSQLGTVPTDPRKVESRVASYGMTGAAPSVMVVESSQSTLGTRTKDLEALLKDIAVNPAVWMNVIKGQQKFEEPAKSLAHSINTSSAFGVSRLSSVAQPSSSLTGPKSIGLNYNSSQMASMNSQDNSVKLRMKPRDPRRLLHVNAIQYNGGSVPEQSGKSEAPATIILGGKDVVDSQSLVNGTDTSFSASPPALLPDIAKQFTTKLKDIADIISVSQSSMAPSVMPQSSLSAVEVNLDRVSVRSGEPEANQPLLRPDQVAAVPGKSQKWGDVDHLFEKYDEQEKAAIQQERARRMEEQNKMFTARKLCLVLDLDHTLLNSAKFTEVDPVHDEILRKKEEQDREMPQRHLFRFPHMGMWTKLRPGIWNFLEKASKLYELHLYTMGNKLYATEMAKVLDPKGVLFAGRVISRGDDGDILDGDDRVPKSKDLEGVLGMESAVVIIDDSVRVWPHNKLNLIVVERYIYFPCSRRQFGLPGPSLLEIDRDERTEDGTLASSLVVIERIHQNFFSNKSLDDIDVRNILASEQRKILAGCRIVFSRMFPVGEANPHLHPLWQTAEQFGAVCTNQIDSQVTHVVANSLGTDKVNWAIAMGKYVVHPGWVEASALLYRRANEQEFAIKP